MRIFKAFFILVLASMLFACAEPVFVYIEPSVAELELSVPKDWKNGQESSCDVKIGTKQVWQFDEKKYDLVKIVSEEYYAYPVSIFDKRIFDTEIIPFSDSFLDKSIPLSEIELPLCSMPIDGLYPGQKGYKLTKQKILYAEVKNQKNKDDILKSLSSSFNAIETVEAKALSWISFSGDVMPGRGVEDKLLSENGEALVFSSMLPMMQNSDFLVGNLETTVTTRGVAWPKTYRFRVKPEVLPKLKNSGYDLLTISNNHIFDYTEQGFSDTIDNLKKENIPFLGAGMTWEEAIKPYNKEINGNNLCLWSLAAFPVERTGFSGLKHASIQRGQPGLLWADDKAISEIVNTMKTRDENTMFVVCVHAGAEYVKTPIKTQTDLYRKLIENGADLIIGHHPHILQAVEWYEGKNHSGLIFYSLGNYLFDGFSDIDDGMITMLVSLCVIDGKIKAIKMYPAKLDGYRVCLSDDKKILSNLYDMSKEWAD